MIKSRAPIVYRKYLNPTSRKNKLAFKVDNEILLQLDSVNSEQKYTKNMYNGIEACIRKYVNDLLPEFWTSSAFGEFAKDVYYVNIDGTPIADDVLDAQEEQEVHVGKNSKGTETKSTAKK